MKERRGRGEGERERASLIHGCVPGCCGPSGHVCSHVHWSEKGREGAIVVFAMPNAL